MNFRYLKFSKLKQGIAVPTIKTLLQEGQARLQAAGIGNAALEARVLLAFVLSCSCEHLLIANEQVLPAASRKFSKLIARRARHEPIAYLIGKKEFYDIEFVINKHVLIPRPETETLIDVVLNFRKSRECTILDLGTGSGCLLLTLLKLLPTAKGVALDVSKQALKVAKVNAKKLGLQSRTKFVNKSWTAFHPKQKFDLIVSNPPYIRQKDLATLAKDIKHFEPRMALNGGEDGLRCYKTIMPIIKKLLKNTGICVLECGQNQHESISRLANKHSLVVKDYQKDLLGIVRCLVICLQ